MTRHAPLYPLLGLLVFGASCEPSPTERPPAAGPSESADAVTARVPYGMVRNVKLDQHGRVLVASYRGVYRYDGKSFTHLTRAIRSPSFWDVLEDRTGRLWCATRDSGAYCRQGNVWRHFTTRQGLASNAVMAVCEDRAGNIWFATGGGASRYDGHSFRTFTIADGLSNNALTTIMQDRTGRVWFGTRGEPCFYDGNTFTVFKRPDGTAFANVGSILEDRNGTIWLGDNEGLWRYDGQTIAKASSRGASAILEDKHGNIWTTGSVRPPGGRVWALSRYAHASLYTAVPSVTDIMSIDGTGALCGMVEAKDGSIWVGALGPEGGVYRYDGKTLTDFTDRAGRP
ncbi:histidine kinase [Hymenobacter sp. BT442]|uniref:Histidine kinase n=2 Tax=Hymenobacter negativus TaxID=2795026 RepID=A0ABS0Q736_9BACT|nr:histidine kinase [Hymenobacter negativus]